jgi:PAS domain S-box-containing protein
MVDDTRLLSRSIAAGIGAVCLLIALMIAVQLIAQVITLDYYPVAIYFSFLSNLVITPGLIYMATQREELKLPALAWTHFSMSLMIIFFSQTYSPFTVAWAILILISSSYYGWQGFRWSSLMLAATAIGYIVLFPQNVDPVLNYVFLSVLVVFLTVFLSYMFVRVIMNSHDKNKELASAQKSELLQVNRLNALLNSISDPVMTLNRDGKITSQNAAAQAFFDTNQPLIGRDLDALMSPIDVDKKPVTVKSLIVGMKSPYVRDDLSLGKGRNARHLSLQMSPIRATFDNTLDYGVVLIIRDITTQKSLEEEKDEFISVTSHELRTPIAIAEGSLSNLLIMQERRADESKLRSAAEEAHKQIVFLANMMNDLSTLSRAERGVGDAVEPIDVNVLLKELFDRYAPEATAKQLQLNLDVEASLPVVMTSRLYLEEILQNFITNSIKYTKKGSVTISAKVQDEDSKVKFSVADTGIGMSEEDLKHIFEKFYRSEDYRTRETSGTGLGLYVVGKLAAKLSTKIEVRSRLDHGSTFSIALAPAGKDDAPTPEAKDQPKEQQKEEPKQTTKPEPKTEEKPEVKPESTTEELTDPKDEPKEESKLEEKPEQKTESKAEPEPKAEPKTEQNDELKEKLRIEPLHEVKRDPEPKVEADARKQEEALQRIA